MKDVIIKQDINFLDKPLWFQDMRHDGLGFIWTDIEGYEYRSGYKIPDKIDALILLYLLMKSQKQKYDADIELTRYEILKGCGLDANSQYYERLKESLERWKNITVKFHGSFYDGKRYLTLLFGIIDDAKIDEETGRIRVKFNESWLLKIKESTFFKYLNFEYYKALKRPLSRRLYEILCKTFKGRNEWSVHLTKLGAKLTMYGREVSFREGLERKTKTVIFASDVLVALKPAINEINRLAETPDIGKKTGIPAADIFHIGYEVTGEKQERVIKFKKIPVNGKLTEPIQETLTEIPNEPDFPDESDPDPEFVQLMLFISETHRKRESVSELVSGFLQSHGFEYVKWNIEYANRNATENYVSYLSLSLKNNWGLRLREEMKLVEQMEQERQKAQAEKQRLEAEEKKKKQAEAEQKAAEQQRLLAIYDSFSDEEKKEMDRKAEERLNNFEKEMLRKHRLRGGKMPELMGMSLEIAMLRVLKEFEKKG